MLRQRLVHLAGKGIGHHRLGLVLAPINRDGLNPALADDVLKLCPVHFLGRRPILIHPIDGQQEDKKEAIHPEGAELGRLALIVIISHYDIRLVEVLNPGRESC